MKEEGSYYLNSKDGYLIKKLPQNIYSEVKDVVDKVQNDFTNSTPYNFYLAGQIDKEYSALLKSKTTEYIKLMAEEYIKSFPRYTYGIQKNINDLTGFMIEDPEKKTINLDFKGEAWINFQKKYEYNPMHLHNGVFSFVIWYKIPFHKEDEIEYGAGKDRGPEFNHNGEFEFVYYDFYNERVEFAPLNVDKKMEGYMAIFPSTLQHIVYPFYTSDDYRITLSGNINYRIEQ